MGPWSDLLNPMPQWVASRTLSGLLHWNATAIEGDAAESVARLKQELYCDLILIRRGEAARTWPRNGWIYDTGSRCIPRCGPQARERSRAFRYSYRKPVGSISSHWVLHAAADQLRPHVAQRAPQRGAHFLERDAGIVDEVGVPDESGEHAVVASDRRLHADRAQALTVGLALVEQRIELRCDHERRGGARDRLIVGEQRWSTRGSSRHLWLPER